MNIVFLDTGTLADTADLSPLGGLGQFETFESTEPSEVPSRIRDAHVVITNKVPISAADIRAAQACGLIVVAASVVDLVDAAAARAAGIEVTPVRGYATDSVAQWTWTLIFALLGRLSYYTDFVSSGRFSDQRDFAHIGHGFKQIAGKRLGIVGFGRIGQRVAAIGTVLGAEVAYHSITGTTRDERYLRLELEELLSTADVVSLHTPRSSLTENLLDEPRLALMRPQSILINTGRGGVLDEAALARMVVERRILGAALDVFEKEPLSADSPLLPLAEAGRILLTPHCAWGGDLAQVALIDEIRSLILHYTQGRGTHGE